MISRTLLRLSPPLTTTFLHHLAYLPPPSFCPNNVATYSTDNTFSSNYGPPFTTTTTTSATSSGGAVPEDGRIFPRPSTITMSPRLHNSVSLIGFVEFPLKQYNTNRRFGVHTVLRVKSAVSSKAYFSINLEMWDELAERALLYLKPNDLIYIAGELGSFKKSTLEGTDIVKYKVTAKELNYVELDEPGKNSETAVISGNDTGENIKEPAVQKFKSKLHLLQVLVANPDEWYDNRMNKKNPKAPDFKHKTTGEPIWLNANDPPWVKKQLELLDSRRSGGPDSDMTFDLSHSLLSDEQLIVPNPTTVEELNCVNFDEGGNNSQSAMNSGNETGENSEEPRLLKRTKRLELLKKMFASPDEWDDLRESKKNQREPDFKHKSTGEELWLNASDPSWVHEEVVLLEARHSRTPNNDVSSKCSWVSDERLIVPNLSLTTQGAVNSRDATGKSTLRKKSDKLQDLFANPEQWYDNRKTKQNPNQPDFKHKISGEAIWLNETDPAWIKEQVEILDSRLSGGPNNAVVS